MNQNLGTAEAHVKLNLDNFIGPHSKFMRGIDKMEQKANGFADRMGKLSDGFSRFRDNVNKGVVIAGAGAFGLAKMTENMEIERVKMEKKLQLTEEQAKRFSNNIQSIFETGIGQDRAEIQTTLEVLFTLDRDKYEKNLKQLTKDTELIVGNAEIQSVDSTELARTADKLQKNIKDVDNVKDAVNAINYILARTDNDGQLLDYLGEYSDQYQKVGFSTKELADVARISQEAGTQADYLYDGIKEFVAQNINDKDGERRTSLEKLLALDYGGWDKTTEEQKDLIDRQIDALESQWLKIKDPVERNRKITEDMLKMWSTQEKKTVDIWDRIGTDWFGSKNEDGQDALQAWVKAVNNGEFGTQVNITDTAQENVDALIDVKQIESLIREIQGMFKDSGLGHAIRDLFINSKSSILEGMELLTEWLTKLAEIMAKVSDYAEKNPEEFKDMLGTGIIILLVINVLPYLFSFLSVIGRVVGGIARFIKWIGSFKKGTKGVSKVVKGATGEFDDFLKLAGKNAKGKGFFGKLIDGLLKAGSSVVKFAGRFGGLFKLLGKAIPWILRIGTKFIPIVGWVLLIVDAIMLLVAAYKNNWLGFKDLMDNILGFYAKFWGGVWEKVVWYYTEAIPTAFKWIWKTVKKFFKDIRKKHLEFIEKVAEITTSIREKFSEAFNFAKEFVFEKIKEIKDKVKEIIKTFVDIKDSIMENIDKAFEYFSGVITENIDKAKEKIGELLGDFSKLNPINVGQNFGAKITETMLGRNSRNNSAYNITVNNNNTITDKADENRFLSNFKRGLDVVFGGLN